jgi:hypothetical protein
MVRKLQVNNTLTLDMKLPGTNQVINVTKATEPYRKIRVSYKFYEGQNPRDPDNIIFGLKFISDAFVVTGIVEDDSLWHIEIGNMEFIPGSRFKVVITWESK